MNNSNTDKPLGYTSSTISGITIGMNDVPEITDKDDKVAKAHKQVDVVSKPSFKKYLALSGLFKFSSVGSLM